MKLTKNLFKGILRSDLKKVNPNWKISNDIFNISEEGLRMILDKKISEEELRKVIRGMVETFMRTEYDAWKDMHYTAGPFEDHYDLSHRAFRNSDTYPKVIYDIELTDDTTLYINNRAVNRHGPSIKIWHPASNIGWYNFHR